MAEPHKGETDVSELVRLLFDRHSLAEIDRWLSTPQPLLGGREPESAISEGDYDGVLAIARRLGSGRRLDV
jgi:hypothetical protein